MPYLQFCAGLLNGSPGFESHPAPHPRPSRKKIICPDAGVIYPAQEKIYPAGEHPEEE